jgi:hypothetical protein
MLKETVKGWEEGSVAEGTAMKAGRFGRLAMALVFAGVTVGVGGAAVTQAADVPVVKARQKGPWKVKVLNPRPWKVEVLNLEELLSEPGDLERQAVHVEQEFDVRLSAAGNPGDEELVSVVTVPPLVRLVIEQIGLEVESPATFDFAGLVSNLNPVPAGVNPSVIDDNGDLRRGISASAQTVLLHPAQPDQVVNHVLTLVRRVPFADNFGVRLYADPGTEVKAVVKNFEPFDFRAAGVQIKGRVTASGYIVLCLPGPLPNTCPPIP